MTVTLYRENRIDQAEEHDPSQLAKDFIATLRGQKYPGYQPSGSLRVDDQLAFWLADPKGMNATWDRDAFIEVLNALDVLMDDEPVRRTVLDALPLPRV